MLQSDERREVVNFKKIRSKIEQGILPKGKTFEEIFKALKETKKPNVLEIFGFLSAKVKRGNSVEDLGLLSCRKVTTAFATYLVDAMQDSTSYPVDVFKYHAMGTGNTAEANTQTALVTQVEDRGVGSLAEDSAMVYKSVGTTTATASRTIAEHGIFSAATDGTMLDRSLLGSTISLENTDEIEWTYKLTVSAES